MSLNALSFYRKSSGVFRGIAAAPLLLFFAVLIVIAPLAISPAANAADITYPGTGTLQTPPGWVGTGIDFTNAIFSGTETAPLSSDNSVTINYSPGGGTIDPNWVYGGLSQLEDATKNEVKLIDGYVARNVYGGWGVQGSATSNDVTIHGGSVGQDVLGGRSYDGNATENKVIISGGTVSQDVYGGQSDKGNADSNAVTISGGTVRSHVIGGWSDQGNADSNTVTISSGGTVGDWVIGGRSEQGNATSNDVTISGGTVSRDVYGGWSRGGNATSNDVTISGGTVGKDVLGGRSYDGNATDNTITISGNGTVSGDVIGGWSSLGNATSNDVSISSGTVGYSVYGGWSDYDGNADSNKVTISGGTVIQDVYGGRSDQGNVESNTVDINGGEVGSSVYGGYSNNSNGSGNTTYNKVTVRDGTVSGRVYGGWSYGSGHTTDNRVIIMGGDIYGAIGGWSSKSNAINNIVTIAGGNMHTAIGGFSQLENATDNTVEISGGTVSQDVYGGQSYDGNAESNKVIIRGGTVGWDVYGGACDNGNATSNDITISGGAVSRDVYGGWSDNGDVMNNTVTISGSPTLTNSYIFGGWSYSGSGNAFNGNTLNFKSSGITVKNVGNFEFYNFYLPDSAAASETMLSVTDADGVDLSGTTVEIFLQGDISLQTGEKISLINSAGGVSASPNNTSSTASQGAFTTYDFDIYTDANNLWAKLVSGAVSQQSNILTDSRLAPLAFLNQGADLVASLEYLEVSGDRRFNTFAVVGGGSSTYDTGVGAEVDVDGFSILTGVMWNAPVNKNSLIVSAFFEAGWGNYDTYRDYGGGDVVRGSGDTDYYGGGLHMRYKWDSDTPGGLYAEASLRVGRNKSDFYTNDLELVSDFSYESSSTYYGAHVGLGYVWQLNSKTRLEAVSKYIWTRLDSDEVTSSTGDRISFDSLSSSRWRTGFRMYHDYGNANAVTLYYGASYEYEFSGDADGRLGGMSLDGISLSGGTGIGELGVMFRPSKDNDRLMMQLGVQGYVGTREGISGTLKLQYAF